MLWKKRLKQFKRTQLIEEMFEFLVIREMKIIANNPVGRCECEYSTRPQPLCDFCEANRLLGNFEREVKNVA